jgi:BirA family transcriptional regulator, biotin operon repressor / biotin---[acetyl-CoA-carboxylase] ligase
MNAALGFPRRHFRVVDSTNRVARELAAAGVPHGTLVTATQQSAGRGRQGRSWSTSPGSSLLMSLVVRDPSPILSLVAGVAVAETVAAELPGKATGAVQIKWPNDVLVNGRKLAGILVEGRPAERWAVLGIGLNVAVRPDEFPPELHDRAGTMALAPGDVETVLQRLLSALERNIAASEQQILEALGARDYLRGKRITWETADGTLAGIAAGIDAAGGLRAEMPDGSIALLDAGEVHIGSSVSAQ